MPFGANHQFTDTEAGNLTAANVNSLGGGLNVYRTGSGSLNINGTAGRYLSSDGVVDFSGTTGVAVGSGLTNVAVYLTVPANVFTVNSGGFPAVEHLPLAEVDTSSTEVVAVRDKRPRAGSTSVGAFGGSFQDIQSAARETEATTTFKVKGQLNIPAGLNGQYRVGWSGVLDNAGFAGEVRLQNTTDAVTVGEPRIRIANGASEKMPVSGVALLVLTGAAKTLELQFRDVAGGNTQGLADVLIEFWRVS